MKKLTFLVFIYVLSLFSAFAGTDTLWTQLLPMSITNVVFAPNGQSIYASGKFGDQNRVMQFDLQGNLMNTHDTIGRIKQFSKDGKYYWTTNCEKYDYKTLSKISNMQTELEGYVINENADMGIAYQTIRIALTEKEFVLFKPSDMSITKRVKHPTSGCQFAAAAISPDAKYFSFEVVKFSLNSKYEYVPSINIEIWDTETLKPIKTLQDTTGISVNYTLKFSPNGKYLGVSYDGKKMWLYNTSDWSLVHTFDFNGFPYMYSVSSFEFSKDNKTLYLGGNDFRKYNLTDFSLVHAYQWADDSYTIDESPDMSKIVCDMTQGYLILLDNTYTSITEPEPTKTVFISPNPTKELLNVNITTENVQIITYSITNIEGNTVIPNIKKELTSGINQFVINVSELTSGVYFFNATLDGQTKSYKFVVGK